MEAIEGDWEKYQFYQEKYLPVAEEYVTRLEKFYFGGKREGYEPSQRLEFIKGQLEIYERQLEPYRKKFEKEFAEYKAAAGIAFVPEGVSPKQIAENVSKTLWEFEQRKRREYEMFKYMPVGEKVPLDIYKRAQEVTSTYPELIRKAHRLREFFDVQRLGILESGPKFLSEKLAEAPGRLQETDVDKFIRRMRGESGTEALQTLALAGAKVVGTVESMGQFVYSMTGFGPPSRREQLAWKYRSPVAWFTVSHPSTEWATPSVQLISSFLAFGTTFPVEAKYSAKALGLAARGAATFTKNFIRALESPVTRWNIQAMFEAPTSQLPMIKAGKAIAWGRKLPGFGRFFYRRPKMVEMAVGHISRLSPLERGGMMEQIEFKRTGLFIPERDYFRIQELLKTIKKPRLFYQAGEYRIAPKYYLGAADKQFAGWVKRTGAAWKVPGRFYHVPFERMAVVSGAVSRRGGILAGLRFTRVEAPVFLSREADEVLLAMAGFRKAKVITYFGGEARYLPEAGYFSKLRFPKFQVAYGGYAREARLYRQAAMIPFRRPPSMWRFFKQSMRAPRRTIQNLERGFTLQVQPGISIRWKRFGPAPELKPPFTILKPLRISAKPTKETFKLLAQFKAEDIETARAISAGVRVPNMKQWARSFQRLFKTRASPAVARPPEEVLRMGGKISAFEFRPFLAVPSAPTISEAFGRLGAGLFFGIKAAEITRARPRYKLRLFPEVSLGPRLMSVPRPKIKIRERVWEDVFSPVRMRFREGVAVKQKPKYAVGQVEVAVPALLSVPETPVEIPRVGGLFEFPFEGEPRARPTLPIGFDFRNIFRERFHGIGEIFAAPRRTRRKRGKKRRRRKR